MARPVLIGMNNPLSTRAGHELFPAPEGCTGHRLWTMLHDRTHASRQSYMDTFERRNLVRGIPWDRTAAKARAYEMSCEFEGTGRVVVLLGQEVRAAFGHPPLLIHPQVIGGCTFRQLPHPSGRNRWYNDPDNLKVAELLLEELYHAYHNREKVQ